MVPTFTPACLDSSPMRMGGSINPIPRCRLNSQKRRPRARVLGVSRPELGLGFCGEGVVPSAAEISHASMKHTIESLDESALTGRRFFLLFLLLLTTLILYPYAEATVFGYYAFRVIGSSAILISVYAANFRRSLLIFVLVLAVPAVIQRFLLPRAHVSSFSIVNM